MDSYIFRISYVLEQFDEDQNFLMCKDCEMFVIESIPSQSNITLKYTSFYYR